MRKNKREKIITKESPFYHYSDEHIENLKNNYIPKQLDDLLEIESGFKNNKKADFGEEDINECVVKAIEYLKNPSNLKKEIEISAGSSIFYSYSCQLAITILSDIYFAAPDDAGKKAGEVLDMCGLNTFKPKLPSRRSYQQIKKFQALPEFFHEEVRIMVDAIEKFRDKSKTRTEDRDNIKKAFREIFRKNPPTNLLIGEKILDKTRTALSFISIKYHVPYRELRDTYYETKRN